VSGRLVVVVTVLLALGPAVAQASTVPARLVVYMVFDLFFYIVSL
jgi:hypothetical protein